MQHMPEEIQSHDTIFIQSFLPFPLFPQTPSGAHFIFSLLLNFSTASFHLPGLRSPEDQEGQPSNLEGAQI